MSCVSPYLTGGPVTLRNRQLTKHRRNSTAPTVHHRLKVSCEVGVKSFYAFPLSDKFTPIEAAMCAFRTLLILGETGTGKSSLCNRLAGRDASSDLFPVSSDTDSCTETTVFQNIPFGGDQKKYVTAIDTMGFNDPGKDIDLDIVAKFIASLKMRCYAINIFGIAINGTEPRLNGPLVEMMKLCEEMFGDIFWKQCCLIFTKTSMNAAERKKRGKKKV